tara:strand:+ start:3118 stop:3228 length:111 start_codon:yes stop_codon:yes gene_type:complete
VFHLRPSHVAAFANIAAIISSVPPRASFSSCIVVSE